MLSDDLKTYRAMTPGERLALGLELSELAWQWVDVPDRETGDRRLAAWCREHDRSNQAMLAILRAERRRALESFSDR